MVEGSDVGEEQAFYSAAAQVIPVLLLVLAVERRRFVLSEMPSRERPLVALIVVLVAVAELLALVALVRPEYRGAWLETFVAAAVGGLVALIVREALWPRRRNHQA